MKELAELFQMQRELDQRVIKEHNLISDALLEGTILAFIVEVGECANETRCFKHWSKKPPSPKEVILEEYIDGFHFLLSLGNTMKQDRNIEKLQKLGYWNPKSLTATKEIVISQFHKVYRWANVLRLGDCYDDLFACYLELGSYLGFEWDEVVQAYYQKNQINHQRQDEGY